MDLSKKIFVIAGEPSADALGGAVIDALKELTNGSVKFEGIGGQHMEKAGLKSLLPMEELCVMGIWEVIWQIPRLKKLIDAVVHEIEERDPDVVLTIDLPDFNFRVADKLKKNGKTKAKLVHYVAPTVWAWRPGRAKKIAQYLDAILCLFPFEPQHFTKEGLRAEFVGHPLVEKDILSLDSQMVKKSYEIDPDATVLGLFFGSRESEIKMLAPVFEETLTILREHFEEKIQLVVPTLPFLEYDVLEITGKWGMNPIIVTDPNIKWEVFKACDVALAASGTVGLELAYLGVPHVIAYKMHPISWQIIKYLVKVKNAHLANILLGDEIVPEYLQGNCNSLKISRGLLELLNNKKKREEQVKKFETLQNLLGSEQEQKPSLKAAEVLLEMMSD